MRLRPLLCCVAAILSVVALSAEPVTRTRFQYDPSGRILVPVRVDGKAHTFVMDTGTRHTTVSPAVATTLNRAIRESRPGVRTIDDVSLALLGMVLPHQTVRLAREQMSDEGIIGAELCKRFIVKVDFRARRITLWPPSAAVGTRHAVVVPADFSSDVPVITATVSGPGVTRSGATLGVGLAVAPGTVSFRYSYAAESGLLDASKDGELPIELRGITGAGIVAVARLPREPEQHTPLPLVDGVVSARALTASWIVFDAPRRRLVLGR
jgi:Aspartyl protease